MTTTYKHINNDYLLNLKELWNLYKGMYECSTNQYKELNRLASFVRMTARQVLRVNNLKDAVDQEMAKAEPNKDVLNSYAFEARRLSEEKCYKVIWEDVAQFYDSAVESLKTSKKPKTSSEIYEDAKQYLLDYEETATVKPVEIDI